MGQTAAQKKRSEAAKKAAETRKKNQEAEEQAQAQGGLTEDVSPEEQEGSGPYVPQHRPLQNAGLDQRLLEDERQAELQRERDVHLERTGDASLPRGRHRTGGTSDWVSQDRPN